MLVILSGCSGVGKNTVINALMGESDRYELLPTYTTRNMRENERQGQPYYFISDEEFVERLGNGEFYEHELVHGHYYGTSRKLLLEKKKTDKILIKDIDVKGTQNLISVAQKDIDILSLFLYVDSKEELTKRLIGRGEKDIGLRLSRYELEMEYADKYSYLINNADLRNTIDTINAIVQFEQSKGTLLPTKGGQEINMDIVRRYAEKLSVKEKIPAIQVAVREEKFYIVDGHHRFLAAMMAHQNIAKEVVAPSRLDGLMFYAWEDAKDVLPQLLLVSLLSNS